MVKYAQKKTNDKHVWVKKVNGKVCLGKNSKW